MMEGMVRLAAGSPVPMEVSLENYFGCGVGLRVAGSVGINLPLGTSLIGTVEHLPDFGSCGAARANTNMGLRLGWRF